MGGCEDTGLTDVVFMTGSAFREGSVLSGLVRGAWDGARVCLRSLILNCSIA